MKMNVRFSINIDCEIDKGILEAISEQHSAMIDAIMNAVKDGEMHGSQIDIDDGDTNIMARIIV